MSRVVVSLVCLVALAGAACGNDDQTAVDPVGVGGAVGADGSIRFYESPAAKDSGAPGDLLADEPIELVGLDGDGRRVTYASTTPRGDVVHVTGVVIVPGGAGGDTGRPVAVWGHPTVGVGTDCAPSRQEPFSLGGAQRLLDAGFIVAAPDYDGLGSGGVHPYLVGESEGRAVLDIARAARELGGSDVVVAWGHSQGGHAVLWARSIVGDYAPDLDLRATAAAAPPTDLSRFLDRGFTERTVLPVTAQTAISWEAVYENAGLSALATDEAVAAAAAAGASSCFVDIAVFTTDLEITDVWAGDPDGVEGWGELTAANSVDPDRGTGPTFLSHGAADELVPIEGSVALADALCARGESVTRRFDDAWTHGSSYSETRDEMLTWLIDATADPPPSDC